MRADEFHKFDSYAYDGWYYRILEVRPPDAKRGLTRFSVETPVGTSVQHEFDQSTELQSIEWLW